jgi:hypothetical protein
LWRPADINEIEMTASRALLSMAAKFRPRYLRQFYEYGKGNLASKASDPQAFIVTAGQPNAGTVSRFLEILMGQGIEIYQMTHELHVKMDPKQADFHEMPLGSFLVFVNQPQKNNVLSLFEKQEYPRRLLANGDAEVPYDVAGWTLPLQMGVDYAPAWQIGDLDKERATLKRLENIDQARAVMNLAPQAAPFAKQTNPLKTNPRIGLYKDSQARWTRAGAFVLDTFKYLSLDPDKDMRSVTDVDAIILPRR